MEAVIFIGIQGVGKSTFYLQRFYRTHVRINLDMLKTRHREEILVRACIQAGQPFVIDNTNILKRERARYIEWARPAGFAIHGYYFPARLQDAIGRNNQRSGDERIPTGGVVAKFHQLQVPHFAEGFDRLYEVRIDPRTSHFTVNEWRESPNEHRME